MARSLKKGAWVDPKLLKKLGKLRQGDKTVITIAMYGSNNFMMKAMGLFINCDKMHGAQLEKGLADLDASASVTGAK